MVLRPPYPKPCRAIQHGGNAGTVFGPGRIDQKTPFEPLTAFCCPQWVPTPCSEAAFSPVRTWILPARATKRSLRYYHSSPKPISPTQLAPSRKARGWEDLYLGAGLRREDPPQALTAPLGVYGECAEVKRSIALRLRAEKPTRDAPLPRAQEKRSRKDRERTRDSIGDATAKMDAGAPEAVERTKQTVKETKAGRRAKRSIRDDNILRLSRGRGAATEETFAATKETFAATKETFAATKETFAAVEKRRAVFEKRRAIIEERFAISEEQVQGLHSMVCRHKLEKWADSLLYANKVHHERKKVSSDLTRRIGVDQSVMEAWHTDYWPSFSQLLVSRQHSKLVKELVWQIETTLRESIHGLNDVLRRAHFARLWQRQAHYCENSIYGAFRHTRDYHHLSEALSMVLQSAKQTELDALSYTHSIWRPRQRNLLGSPPGNGLIDGCRIIGEYAARQCTYAYTFYYGVLSSDRTPSFQLQLRRQQAAVLNPFWDVLATLSKMVDVDFGTLRKDFCHLEGNDDLFTRVGDHLSGLRASLRDFRSMLNGFVVYNWMSTAARPLTRTFFLREPPSQPHSFAPVTFSVPPGHHTRSRWNYSDYRGLNGERISTFYCANASALNSALSQFHHNGVISLDVRWPPSPKQASAALPPSFASHVPIITLASQSRIVILHLAVPPKVKHGFRLPSSVRELLRDPKVIKVGVGMEELSRRLQTYTNVSLSATCDVCSLFSEFHPLQCREDSRLQWMVEHQYKRRLPTSGGSWLHSINLDGIIDVACAAYASLRLFFRLTNQMLGRTSVQKMPLRACSNETLQNLSSLFPSSTSKQVSLPVESEDVGPLTIMGHQDQAARIAQELALDLEERRIKEQPALRSTRVPLRLFYLYNTLGQSWESIESLQPKFYPNLPALILEVITIGNLDCSPDCLEGLQKMAWVQFRSREKISNLAQATKDSFEMDRWELSNNADTLMALIRQKAKARRWLGSLQRPDSTGPSERPIGGNPMPFAMWWRGGMSESNISKLLVLPPPRVVELIVHGALRLKPGRGVLKDAFARDPATWRDALEHLTANDRAGLLEVTKTPTLKAKDEPRTINIPAEDQDEPRTIDIPAENENEPRSINIPAEDQDEPRSIDIPAENENEPRSINIPAENEDEPQSINIPAEDKNEPRSINIPAEDKAARATQVATPGSQKSASDRNALHIPKAAASATAAATAAATTQPVKTPDDTDSAPPPPPPPPAAAANNTPAHHRPSPPSVSQPATSSTPTDNDPGPLIPPSLPVTKSISRLRVSKFKVKGVAER